VLAGELSRSPEDPEGSLRRYEKARQTRTARIQRAARRNDFTYHLHEPVASIRDTILGALGGERLLAQYDWIYQWRPYLGRRFPKHGDKCSRPLSPAACLSPHGLPSPASCGRRGGPPGPSSKPQGSTPPSSRSSCRRMPASTSSPTASSRGS